MYKNNKISLIIPAYNEERLIVPTLESVPELIDKVYVVDDCSTDTMPEKVNDFRQKDNRIELIQHEKNMGVGQAIINGYKQSLAEGYDIAVVIGGDNQMLLSEVTNLLDPIINNEADYTKGNRFLIEGNVFENMPKIRQFGNAVISLLTKIASGLFKIYDVVDGYTAINKKAIMTINWEKAWKGYGYPMDFLIRLNAYNLRVKDVPRTEVYLKGERQSQIKGLSYALKVSPMLLRGFFWRLLKKYLYRNFHPLVFLYFLGIFLIAAGFIWGAYLVMRQVIGTRVSGPKAVIDAILFIIGFQSLLFAMLFEIYEDKQ
jgi:glycosyltransferase involved in cell wall biosynthesis